MNGGDYKGRHAMTNPYAPPQAIVADVIDAADGIHLADRSTRFSAAFLDGLIIMVMVYLPFMLSVMLGGNGSWSWIGLVVAGAGFIVWLFFTVKFLGENGQSIGKKACKIKILRKDGSEVSISRVIIARNLMNGLLGLIPFYALIDALFILGNKRRCVHDYIADTIVVKA
jgi:uncharacterized RDD family membrane protein YckC